MNDKPLWVEKFLDDKDLFELFEMNSKLLKKDIFFFEHCIDLEKRDVRAKEAKLARSMVSSTIELIAIQKRLIERLEQSKFLSVELAEEYRQKIQNVQDMAKEITIRENLNKESGE